MTTLSEKTKVKVYDVVNSLPVIVTVIIAAAFVYFQGNANARDIEEIKSDKKESEKELASELKKINESLAVIKTTLKIKEEK